jgi:hypothetical protein
VLSGEEAAVTGTGISMLCFWNSDPISMLRPERSRSAPLGTFYRHEQFQIDFVRGAIPSIQSNTNAFGLVNISCRFLAASGMILSPFHEL